MKYVPYLFTAAWDVIVIPLILVIHLFWGSKLRMEDLAVCTNLKTDSWPMDVHHWIPYGGWYSKWAGTSFGHAIMYRPASLESTKVHEHIHVHQFEATMLKSFIVGLLVLLATGKLWLAGLIWASGYLLYLCCNWTMAVIRGGAAYKGSVHEEHAYAVGELWLRKHQEEYQRRINKV